jgi:hypothetical protein
MVLCGAIYKHFIYNLTEKYATSHSFIPARAKGKLFAAKNCL